jgi:hypothetical protein
MQYNAFSASSPPLLPRTLRWAVCCASWLCTNCFRAQTPCFVCCAVLCCAVLCCAPLPTKGVLHLRPLLCTNPLRATAPCCAVLCYSVLCCTVPPPPDRGNTSEAPAAHQLLACTESLLLCAVLCCAVLCSPPTARWRLRLLLCTNPLRAPTPCCAVLYSPSMPLQGDGV